MLTVWFKISLHNCSVCSESYTVNFSVKYVHIYLTADSVPHGSDCADVLADLELHCLYMSEDPFLN